MNCFNYKPLFLLLLSCLSLSLTAAEEGPKTPQEALKRLMEGNERYTKDALIHPNRSQTRREALTQTQNPFATVVGCSDSRVSPVIIFDQGIGDIFEVRLAGNVVGPVALASIEFSAQQLGASIVFVVGHEGCAAVNAALKGQTQDIEPITDKIKEALKGTQKFSDNPLENAIKANVNYVVNEIRKNPAIKKLIDDKKLEIVGGYYNLQSGKVDICCDIP